jgi:hypothetical protein
VVCLSREGKQVCGKSRQASQQQEDFSAMGEWEMDTENVLSNHDLKVEGLKGNREEVLLGREIWAVH